MKVSTRDFESGLFLAWLSSLSLAHFNIIREQTHKKHSNYQK